MNHILHLTKRQALVLAALLFVAIGLAATTYALDASYANSQDARAYHEAAARHEVGNDENQTNGRPLTKRQLGSDKTTTPNDTQAGVLTPQQAEAANNTPAPQTPITQPVERPAVTQPQPGVVNGVVDKVKDTVTETLNCQYPLRPLINGQCDNSDPCDPTTLKDPELYGQCRN